MKRIFIFLTLIIILPTLAFAETDGNTILDYLTEGRTTWNFTADEVSADDLNTILKAGVNTASAINEQPWTFSVITDPAIVEELADTESTRHAPVMILVSVNQANEMKILDAGLAVQSMQIAARILGYATKIETTAARTVRNDKTGVWAARLGIPEEKSARAALFIGYEDTSVDAVTHASSRKLMEEVVTYVTPE